MKRPASAHILALAAAFAAILAVSALWIVNLRAGPPLDGWVAGPMVIFVPGFILILTAFWLIVRGILHGRVHWRITTVIPATVIPALLLVIVNCGAVSCFVPGNNNRLLGWFVVGGLAFAALVHHLVLNRFTPISSHGR